MSDLFLFDIPGLAAGRLVETVAAWAASVDGVPAPAVEHVRMLAAVFESQVSAVARDAAAGRAAPAAQLAALTKVSRELREALGRLAADAERLSRSREEGSNPLAQLLGELSAPLARHHTGT